MVGLGCLVYGDDRPTGFDRDVADALPAQSDALALLADLGNTVPITLLALVTALAATKLRRPDLMVAAVAAPLAGAILSVLGKHLVDRDGPEGLAYPSGHATVVAALAVVVVLLATELPTVKRIALQAGSGLVVLGSSAGLVTEDYHYATDTMGGMCLGIATTTGVTLRRRATRAGSSAR